MATIRKRGASYQVQVRRNGRQITKSFRSLADARLWAREIEAQADREGLPPQAKALRQITLGDLVRRYRTVAIQKRSWVKEQFAVAVFLRHPICNKSLAALRPADFAAYRDHRLRTIKPSSLRRELAPIRHMFEIAKREWGLPIRENPLAGLKINGADRRRERRLQPGELDRLLAAASRHKLMPAIIAVAVLTGMRRGEILAMKWADVDLQRKAIHIPVTKTGHSRTIPLFDAVAEILDRLPRTGERVFPMTGNAVRLAWERIKRKAGVVDLHFHDLRHEAISRFFEAGLSVPEVALISGHRDPRMLFRYSHPLREQILAKVKITMPDGLRTAGCAH